MKIFNPNIKEYFKDHDLKVLEMDENRPWGAWYVYEEGVDKDKNESLDKKVLCLNSRDDKQDLNCLSLQYHGSLSRRGHHEVWEAITRAVVLIGKENMVGKSKKNILKKAEEINILELHPGEKIEIPSGFLHAMVNPYLGEEIIWKEVRISSGNETPEEREKNISRVYDDSGRDGVDSYPKWLKEKILAI